MEARRWQSPAVAAAAAEAAEEDGGGGGAGGPSRRPPRRGLHRASPYGFGPRRLLPKLPLSSRIVDVTSGDRAASENNKEVHRESLDVIHERNSIEQNTDAAVTRPQTSMSNKFSLLLEDDYKNPSDGSGLAEIEKMINQRCFTRDETEHLIEIMRSRTPDLSFEDQRGPGSTAKGFDKAPFSTPAKLIDPQTSWRTDIFQPSNVHEAGSSPIEIAKAFMEAQTLTSAHESQKRRFIALSHGVETENSTSKILPKVTTDSSVCWPGTVVRDYPNYLTPQSNKGTLPFSRTPYKGSVFGRSIKKSKLGGTSNDSSRQSQLSTPFSVGSKTRLVDKVASTSGVTTTFFPREGPAATKNAAFNLQGTHGKGIIENSSTPGRLSAVDIISRGISGSAHPKSSETAYKILQHLEKTISSPATKPLELRHTLAKRNASATITNSQSKGTDSNISNGHGQSSGCKSGTVDIADAKKVSIPLKSGNVKGSSLIIQSSRGNSEVPDMHTCRDPPKSDLRPTSAAEVLDKNASKGFMFTFPVAKAPTSLEPPPTPTMASPARSLPINTEDDVPKFTFRSSSELVFSFDSGSGSVGADGTAPTFNFGSQKMRELCFDIAGKDAVCF